MPQIEHRGLWNQGIHLAHQGFAAGGGNVVDEQHILYLVGLGEIHDAFFVIPVIDDVHILIMRHQEGDQGVAEGFLDDRQEQPSLRS